MAKTDHQHATVIKSVTYVKNATLILRSPAIEAGASLITTFNKISTDIIAITNIIATTFKPLKLNHKHNCKSNSRSEIDDELSAARE